MRLPKLTAQNLEHYTWPLQTLHGDTRRKFGTMSPADMCSHLRHTLEVSYGAKVDPDHSSWLSRGIGRIVVFHIFTHWPGGVIKQPDSWSPPATERFEDERDALVAALKKFAEEREKSPEKQTLSPLLGMRTLAYWSHLHAVHFAHHYRQFGI